MLRSEYLLARFISYAQMGKKAKSDRCIVAVQALPRFDADSEVVSEAVMGVSWGADHRVIDGATLTRFSNACKSLLEEPTRLLLHMR